mgnify:CR=1 FL=1
MEINERHMRRCWACGTTNEHESRITPGVCCPQCGSQDTRPVKAKPIAIQLKAEPLTTIPDPTPAPEEYRAAAMEVVNAVTVPPLEQCYGVDPVVPIQAWLSAKAVACGYLADADFRAAVCGAMGLHPETADADVLAAIQQTRHEARSYPDYQAKIEQQAKQIKRMADLLGVAVAVYQGMPEPKLGGWNWPQMAKDARKAVEAAEPKTGTQ